MNKICRLETSKKVKLNRKKKCETTGGEKKKNEVMDIA